MRRPSVVPTTRVRPPARDHRDADQLGEVAGARTRRLRDDDAPLGGDARCVDGVDLVLGVAREDAEQHRGRERAAVAVGEPAEILDLDAVDRAVLPDHRGEPAEAPAEREERAEHLEVLGRDRGDVDRGRDAAAGQRGDDLLGGLEAGAVGGLRGGGAEVRGDDDVRVGEQRALGHRLAAEDVERGAADLPGVERGLQVLIDDQRPAGDVEDPDAVLHLRERGSAFSQPSVSGVLGRWTVMKSAAA